MAKSSWLTVSPTSGFGNKTIQNIGATHTGRLQRQTVVTGRAIGIATTKTYTVTQKAKEEFITIGASSYSVANTGGIVTVSGTSNSPKLTVSVGSGGTLGSLVVNGSTVTNGAAISGDPGATAQYSWSIQIQVGENLTAVQKGINVTVTGSSSSVTDTVQIVQAASVFDYIFNIAAGTETIPASGGNSAITAQLTTKRNGREISTKAVTPTLSGSATGFSISGTTVTATNRGTTLGEARSIVVTGKFTTSETGEILSDTVTISQAANNRVIVYSKPNITDVSAADIPASGGSVSSASVSYSQSRHYYYDSGATEELSALTTGGTINYGTAVSGSNLGTTVTERAIVGQLTFTVSMNGQTSVEDSIAIYQAANSKNEVSRVITVSVPSGDIPAEGGTKTVTRSGVINYSFTSGATTTSSFTPTLSISGTGFSLNGTTVTAANRSTTVGERRSATVTASYEGATSKTATVYQEANAAVSITYGTPSVSLIVADIPAKGGTISSGTVTYSQSRTQNYTSGSTSPLSDLTTGGTVSYSTGVSGSDLGTTTKARTKIGTLTATVTMNGKSGSDSADVYQQANSITYGRVTISGTGSVADIPAGGGSVSTASGYTASQTISYTSEHTRAGNVKFTYSTVSANSLGKTEKARTAVGTMTVTATGEGSQKATTTITVYQQANVRTTGEISYGSWQVSVYAREYVSTSSPCPASGDSFTIYSGASRTRTQNYNYTSGSTDTETLSNETATPELSVSGEGGLTLSGNTATYANRGTTEGNLRSNTILATYGGAYDTEQVYQEENVKTAGDISYGDWQVSVSANRYITTSSPCPASGGTCTITASATRTRNQSYSYTSGATSTEVISNETGTPTLSISGTGASLSGTTVTWVTRGTEYSTTTRSATVKATMGTVTAEEVVYQAKNGYTEEWDNPVVDMQPSSHTISSIGNDWYVDSFSATQFGTRTYDSGSIQEVTNSEFTWSSSENVDWLSSQVEFNEDFCITSDDNEGSSSRSGVVTLTATGKGDKTGSDTITITQEAGAYLNVSPTSLSFEASGGTKTITIDTNESWTIS